MGKFKTNQSLVNAGFNQVAGQTLSLSGNTLIGSTATLKYSTDQSSTYVARSIVDAAYVTGKTSAICNIGSAGQVIYRGTGGITGATGFIYTSSGVTVTNLCISVPPPNDVCLDFLLSWDNTSKQVHSIPYATAVGLTCACNGLTALGGTVCLGGNLCINTAINGCDIYSLQFCNLCNACIITTANNIVLDSRNNTGGIYLKSQSGAISSPVGNYSNSVGIAMDYPSCIFKIYDNRIGANQKGIEYDGNYSTFYTARSLVDKTYVDTIANGLHPKQAVQAATTVASGNTILSGCTGTIDGISISNIISGGNRILVKNQTNGALNGIYSASTGNWGRTSDFDFVPITGEVVQGSYFFVISGTNRSTTWVLTTPDIITSGNTLTFTLFSQITDVLAGTGITITVNGAGEHTVSVNGPSLAGNSLLWNNSTCQFDVNPSGAALTGATNGLSISGQNVKLGGTLTGNTYIGITNGDLIITGGTGSTSYSFNKSCLSLMTGCGASFSIDDANDCARIGTKGSAYIGVAGSALEDYGAIVTSGGSEISVNGRCCYISLDACSIRLCTAPPFGSTSDAVLVWNSGDTQIKQISLSAVNVCNVNSQYTVTTANNFIGVSGTTCIFLMNNPSCGQKVSIADICGDALSNPITINGNGKRINDSTCTCSIINTNYGSITFIYNGYFWSAVAFTN